jgi:hypothetical protein
MVDFYNFQKDRRSGLLKVLQGENLMALATQQTETQNPEVEAPANKKPRKTQ